MLEFREIELRQNDFKFSADFAIKSGAHVAVVGPSGAGKSTLLSIAGGFSPPQVGDVFFRSAPLTHKSPSARPIAHLFQDNNLFPHMSVFQNIGLGIRPNLKFGFEEIVQIDAAIEAVGLQGLSKRRPAELSGGQQSRVALARVLVQSKPIILLDEPFSALGPAMRQEMILLARKLGEHNQATMLMVTHDLADIKSFASHVIWVEDGECQAPRALADFQTNPPSGFVTYSGQ